MINTEGYAAHQAKEPLKPFSFQRRDVGVEDVLIDILYSGVCHSDIHQARDEWGGATFPMVPGHEIVGQVLQVGSNVTRFKVGDPVGVGCFVSSCRSCEACSQGEEQYCTGNISFTYNSVEKDGKTPTYGGYATKIVVDQSYVLRVSPKLPLAGTAPLLCAGITTYSPLRQWKVRAGTRVGVIGLGGLGHMAVKFAAAMEAEVTVLSTSERKKADAERLGARHFAVTKNESVFKDYANYFDLILNTVSAPIDLNTHLDLLKRDGTLVLLGVPDRAVPLQAFPLISKRRRLAGSLIGGIRQTQEMLDFCADHQITSDIEMISLQKINEAYERVIQSDVRYRFVIDIQASFPRK